jgi:twitching motility protein PilT
MVEVDVSALDFKTTDRVKGYLELLIKEGGSDLHLKSEGVIKARVKGEIRTISEDILSRRDALTLSKEVLRGRFGVFVEEKQIDFTFSLNEDYRFRGNFFFQKDGVSAVFRVIPTDILSLDALDLPMALDKLVQLKRGIVLVTGATGSGKSTTLAAMIDAINRHQRKHIITIEDPIEFIHKDKQSMMNQRSVGEDAISFGSALKGALREDPDVILVGEMRDLESIEMALHAAETGHLVFSTLHTIDAKETLNRIIGTFPPHEQARIRLTLASTLEGVVSQRLIKTIGGGRKAVIELLLKTSRIEELIRKKRDDEITDALEEGREIYGTQTFDQALLELVADGFVTQEMAIETATSPDNLKLKLSGMQQNRSSQSADMAPIIGLKKSD